MDPARLKITFPIDTDAEFLDLAVESGLGGMGTAYRGAEDRVIFLHRFEWPYKLIKAQLDQMKEDKAGFSWEIAI
jgi:hypothetical protein